jgi:hypothetical protein
MRTAPLWQWAVGLLTQIAAPDVAENTPFRASLVTPPSINHPQTARQQLVSTYNSKLGENQRRRSHAMSQRRRCYLYLTASLVVLVVAFVISFAIPVFPPWTIVLPAIVAVVAFEKARRHDCLVRDCGRLLDLYERRLLRVNSAWVGRGDPGMDLLQADHLSAADLDLFGEGSLFELLCDVQTPAGRDALAQWLQTPAPWEVIPFRQRAIRSLQDRIDLREKFALLRGEAASEYSWQKLCDWLVARPLPFPRWAPWAGIFLSVVLISAGLCGWTGLLEVRPALWLAALAGATQAALAILLRSRIKSCRAAMFLPASKFESMRRMCELVEGETLEAPVLGSIQLRLQGSTQLIQQLQRLVVRRDLRNNELLFWPLLPVLWTTQWTMRIERWRVLHGLELREYLTALGEFEAVMAIAAYAYENPDDRYPELVSEGPVFEAVGMRHPLMDPQICVPNDITLGAETRFLLVTGSNMSGKSTLLRAVGLNATLAQMGAPARAVRLRLSPLQVCASIAVHDSLADGRSHFYAEVARLKAMLDRAVSGSPVFFLIDELFAGTNSADRRVAAEAVVRLLVERQAMGLVTSHDLALTEISEIFGLKGTNVHFEDSPIADGLSFDYRLRPGKVRRSNALKIIKMIGIPLT